MLILGQRWMDRWTDRNDGDGVPLGYSVKLYKLQLLCAVMKSDEYARCIWKVRWGKSSGLLKVQHQHSPGQTARITTRHLPNMEQVCVRFEVPVTVNIKITVFSYVVLSSLVDIRQSCKNACCLHRQLHGVTSQMCITFTKQECLPLHCSVWWTYFIKHLEEVTSNWQQQGAYL